MIADNKYYDEPAISSLVRSENYRELVGGLWDELGQLQYDFLISHGLQPSHYLLDIGCGCLRGGVRFVSYLDCAHYYGLDISPALLDAGYNEIVQVQLGHKLPRENLIQAAEFDCTRVKRKVDFALAQSLFTHLSLNHLRLCLCRLAFMIQPQGRFYVTFFELPDGALADSFCHGEITTFTAKDPFHYLRRDLEYIALGTGWRAAYIGEWGHPRNQMMMCYIRENYVEHGTHLTTS